jgi:hypothetical protein
MSRLLIALFLVGAVSACSTTENQTVNGPASTQDRIGKAIVSPLGDINLVQDTISPVLTEALKNPYQMPVDNSCAGLTEQVKKLDATLGADLDANVVSTDKSMSEKGSVLAQDEAVGSVERTINGAIPFRSWIRKFSGAEKHSKEMTAAIAAGIVRRAFLKGVGQEHGCAYPAAPLKPTVTQSTDTPATSAPATPAAPQQ